MIATGFDLLKWTIIILAPVPILVAAFRRTIYGRSLPHAILTMLIGWTGVEISIGIMLGIMGELKLIPLLCVELLILMAGLVLQRNHWRSMIAALKIKAWQLKPKEYEAAILVGLGIVCAAFLWRVITIPVTEYDSLSYHLPQIARWLQSGSFQVLEQYPQVSRYPYNWEILSAISILPFREDLMALTPNVIAWVIAGLAIYLLSRQFSVCRYYALTASALFMLLPIISIDHIAKLHVDLPLAAFFLSSLYFGCDYIMKRDLESAALAALSIGIMTGIKTTGPIYVLILIPGVWMLGRFARPRDKPETAFAAKTAANLVFVCAVGLAVLLAGFWFTKNLLETANPFGPVRVTFGDKVILPGETELGYYHDSSLVRTFPMASSGSWQQLIDEANVWLNFPFYFAVLAIVAFGINAIRTGQSPRRGLRSAILLTIIGGVCFLLYLNTPSSGSLQARWMGMGFRFAFPALGVMAVVLALALDNLKIPKLILFVTVAVSVLAVLNGLEMVKIALIVLVAINFLKLSGWLTRIHPFRHQVALILLMVLILVGAAQSVRTIRDENRIKAYGFIDRFLDKYVPENIQIGALHRNKTYVLYGKDLSRPVIYVQAKAEESESEWLSRLKQEGIGIVAFGPAESRDDPRELAWVLRPGSKFVKIFGNYGSQEPCLYQFIE